MQKLIAVFTTVMMLIPMLAMMFGMVQVHAEYPKYHDCSFEGEFCTICGAWDDPDGCDGCGVCGCEWCGPCGTCSNCIGDCNDCPGCCGCGWYQGSPCSDHNGSGGEPVCNDCSRCVL